MIAPARRMLTSQEAAEYCGFKSVRQFTAHVRCPSTKFGSAERWDRHRLDDWLDTLTSGGQAESVAAIVAAAGDQ